MKDQILQRLHKLRNYALSQGYEMAFFYHEEDSHLMRFANSAISLNTNEHLIRLEITAYAGKRRASYELITEKGEFAEMKRSIDLAAELVLHAQPLTYQPTVPFFKESFADESGYDSRMATLSNEERLEYFNKAVAGLEEDQIKLAGIFSCGVNTIAQISTKSEHTQFFKTSDAQVSISLAHTELKWEAQVEQSAQKKSDLNPMLLHRELAFLVDQYLYYKPQQLPLAPYNIVFGSAATASLVGMIGWVGFNGGTMKRGLSFLTEKDVGQKVFSEQFNLSDDPTQLATYPLKRDFYGLARNHYPIFQNGVFQGFLWSQDDADEFSAQPTGHTVSHESLVLAGGDKDVSSLSDLVNMPRDRDILYIPFLHYLNVVNPSEGVITGSSRFGALLLKRDGSVTTVYNVRLTQKLQDLFGDKVAWLSRSVVPYNTSNSYGARNPTAVIVPQFMQVNDLEISQSNSSF